MSAQDDLDGLSRDELVERVKQLREELRQLSRARVAAPTSSAAPRPVERAGVKFEGKKKRPREFDMSRYVQRKIALRIAYDGRTFHGLAAQEDSDNTIEAHLFNALTKTCLITSRTECGFSRGGRTDKGVSATGQVVALTVRSGVKKRGPDDCIDSPCAPADDGAELDYVTLLNRVLPAEIRVLAWAPVEESFDARFSATHRVYRYFFVRGALDLARMQQAASHFIGEHDFRNFCKADTEHVAHFVRTLLAFEVLPVEPAPAGTAGEAAAHMQLCACVIKGRAFLWHQVRCMVAVLFLVGQGLEEPDVVAQLLDVKANPCKPQYNMAAEHPLVLCEIGYRPAPEFTAGHRAAQPRAKLLRDALQDVCARSVHRGYSTHLLGVLTGGADERTWWPADGHAPGGVDCLSAANAARGGAYTPLLRRTRNAPLQLRDETTTPRGTQ